MGNLKKIKFIEEELTNIPLHFRKIYHNKVSDIKDEEKLLKYNSIFQSDLMRDYYPNREISKTVDFNIFNKDEEE